MSYSIVHVVDCAVGCLSIINFSVQERGAVKEEQFRKKVEEYKAAKEGFHSAFQGLAAVEPRVRT